MINLEIKLKFIEQKKKPYLYIYFFKVVAILFYFCLLFSFALLLLFDFIIILVFKQIFYV